MSFTKKTITLKFTLPTTGGQSGKTVTVSGLRVSATIVKAGGSGMGQVQLRVFGLSPTLMQQLSTYGAPVDTATGATVEVNAGDAETGLALLAKATITAAYADYNQMPDVAFMIQASQGLEDAIRPVTPISIRGSADAAQIMAQLAKTMGYAFENNGVTVKFSNPYFSGTARTQALECAAAGDFNWIIDDDTLAIWPRNGSRDASPIIMSPDTGMVGYPTFTLNGVIVRALINPAIKYGSVIQVQSSLKPACGKWSVYHLLYELESETPDGAWFMTMQALSPNYVETVNEAASASPLAR